MTECISAQLRSKCWDLQYCKRNLQYHHGRSLGMTDLVVVEVAAGSVVAAVGVAGPMISSHNFNYRALCVN